MKLPIPTNPEDAMFAYKLEAKRDGPPIQTLKEAEYAYAYARELLAYISERRIHWHWGDVETDQRSRKSDAWRLTKEHKRMMAAIHEWEGTEGLRITPDGGSRIKPKEVCNPSMFDVRAYAQSIRA